MSSRYVRTIREVGVACAALALVFAAGCGDDSSDQTLTPGRATMPRLTSAQYHNAIADLLGPGLPQPPLEIDTKPYLFSNVVAARTTIGEEGVQQWEQAAHTIAAEVVSDEARRETVVGCDPVVERNQCVTTFLSRFGRRAWRRPLTVEELSRYASVATDLGDGDPWKTIYYALAGLLQSPNFLYRVTNGADDEGTSRHLYTTWEMASRLSFLFWNTTPDDALLSAAMREDLGSPEGVRAHAQRLIEDPRARAGLRTFFSELLGLGTLDHLQRDPEVFPQISPTLGPSMRHEIEMMVDDIVFDADMDIRELFATRATYVNAELAALYGLPPVSADVGFVRVIMPAEVGRAGVLTTAGMLAASSLDTRTSPTKRGIMVRNFLCESVPPPPPDVMAQFPEMGSTEGLTVRQRLELHRAEPRCATCHALMDPIGIGLDEFDAIGARRTMEAGVPVDSSGELDEIPFEGGVGLAELLRQDERVPRCLLIQAYRYAAGRLETSSELDTLNELSENFEAQGYSFKSMLIELVASDLFRYMAPPETATDGG